MGGGGEWGMGGDIFFFGGGMGGWGYMFPYFSARRETCTNSPLLFEVKKETMSFVRSDSTSDSKHWHSLYSDD